MNHRVAIAAALLPLSILSASCAGQRPALHAIEDMNRVRAAPSTRESAPLAPQAYASAEQQRARALEAQKEGDLPRATLFAERAVAAYNRGVVLARLARATRELDEATAAQKAAESALRTTLASRLELEQESALLDKKIKVANELLAPVPSGPADPKREAARLVATRALAAQAHLICQSAELIGNSDRAALAQAEAELAAVEKTLERRAKSAPIDAAARARAACLDALTRIRRAHAKMTGEADALLAELSAGDEWTPYRDERGVVVVLRDTFGDGALTARGAKHLATLAQVAHAHPGVGVQVVLHTARTLSANEAEKEQSHLKMAVHALLEGGAPSDRTKGEAVFAKNPLVDPQDARLRERNTRLEIVFVTRGN